MNISSFCFSSRCGIHPFKRKNMLEFYPNKKVLPCNGQERRAAPFYEDNEVSVGEPRESADEGDELELLNQSVCRSTPYYVPDKDNADKGEFLYLYSS